MQHASNQEWIRRECLNATNGRLKISSYDEIIGCVYIKRCQFKVDSEIFEDPDDEAHAKVGCIPKTSATLLNIMNKLVEWYDTKVGYGQSNSGSETESEADTPRLKSPPEKLVQMNVRLIVNTCCQSDTRPDLLDCRVHSRITDKEREGDIKEDGSEMKGAAHTIVILSHGNIYL